VVDFYRARRKQVSDASALKLARAATVSGAGAARDRDRGPAFEVGAGGGLTIGSIPMGALLGVSCWSADEKAAQSAAIAGTVAGWRP